MRIALPWPCDARVAAACLAVALSAVALVPTSVAAQVDGEALYVKWCAGCHGEDGTGNGVAFFDGANNAWNHSIKRAHQIQKKTLCDTCVRN